MRDVWPQGVGYLDRDLSHRKSDPTVTGEGKPKLIAENIQDTMIVKLSQYDTYLVVNELCK